MPPKPRRSDHLLIALAVVLSIIVLGMTIAMPAHMLDTKLVYGAF